MFLPLLWCSSLKKAQILTCSVDLFLVQIPVGSATSSTADPFSTASDSSASWLDTISLENIARLVLGLEL